MTGGILGWVSLVAERFAFGVKLKRVCKKKGYCLCENGKFWWLGRNGSGKYNFTVKCGDESYCVKLIGVRKKVILFGFINETLYEIKDYTFAVLWTMNGIEYEYRSKQKYDFRQGAKPCIVMVPESAKVTIRVPKDIGGRVEIGSHDTTPEGTFYFGKEFLDMLEKKQ